ncbi:peptide-methionine (R)-S-oxide reductase MsrB [Hoeflea prorocentri]|uniref:peptide-methionine (R)-S-oxide reductase n=1 Tax=Hoeflea prorocentri TaxID=1922333 RepID=A0A9X3UJX7_9HYPH|nr:peptide-methionine (R)-S-oxide reductase MsrB [Hoeflea prorocentri]MCY6382712.1 peptide-methionine (R)-S-oxide reductase MsrB [Hoeflea prorocentri]MDA5400512.1 peptide-methionine (R)-S-oxide reductase MsrB [Hoeflea prorocentri]
MNRRAFLLSGAAVAAFGGLYAFRPSNVPAEASEGTFEITYSEAEWRERLSPNQFAVLREEATERPYTSELLYEKREGTYNCAGCAQPLYASETKYDSGTGWPSFYEALTDAVGTKRDFKLVLPRTEVHCSRCGGHLGHIFNDGPPPTGMRHCINGLALTFEAQAA